MRPRSRQRALFFAGGRLQAFGKGPSFVFAGALSQTVGTRGLIRAGTSSSSGRVVGRWQRVDSAQMVSVLGDPSQSLLVGLIWICFNYSFCFWLLGNLEEPLWRHFPGICRKWVSGNGTPSSCSLLPFSRQSAPYRPVTFFNVVGKFVTAVRRSYSTRALVVISRCTGKPYQ